MAELRTSKFRGSFRLTPGLLLVVFACLASVQEARAQWPATENCTNGVDDDGDGMIDELDPSCNCFSLVEAVCDPDFEYLIPPVWHMDNERFGGQSELVITTLEALANFTIRDGNGKVISTGKASKGGVFELPVASSLLQTNATNTLERDKGFVVVSDAPIQILYRIGAEWNKILVTVKGRQALGKVFRAGSQTLTAPGAGPGLNDPEERHFISVMADENDTKVTFTFPADFAAYQIPGKTHTVTLNKHQTYLVRDTYPNNKSVSGTLITSDKAISVVSGSQHTSRKNTEDDAGKDGGVDQLVPVCLTGQDYAVVRGKGSPLMHYVSLVAIKKGTKVTVTRPDGSTEVVNLIVGGATSFELGGNDSDFGKAFFFHSDIPYYLYQFSGVASNNEPGMAISAPVGACRGDKLVEFARFSPTRYEDEGNQEKEAEHAVHVIVPTTALGSLTLNGTLYTSLNPKPIEFPVPGGLGLTAITFTDKNIKKFNSIECDDYFSAAMLVGIDGSAGTFGYLSTFKGRMDFIDPVTKEVTTGYTIESICNDEAVEHEIEVTSCASSHRLVDVNVENGTVKILGGTKFSYTPAAGYSGRDELVATVQNSEGYTQSICLAYEVCQRKFDDEPADEVLDCDAGYPKLVLPKGIDGCGNVYKVLVDSVPAVVEFDSTSCTSRTIVKRRFYLGEDCGDKAVEYFQTITINCKSGDPIEAARRVNLCTGDSYDFRGEQITADATRTYPVVVPEGCDSLITLNFAFSPPPSTRLPAVKICEGESYTFDGKTYTASEQLQAVFSSGRGCDSTVSVELVVGDTASTTLSGAICEGGSYVFDGRQLTKAGTYFYTLATRGGCDSTITLNLAIRNFVTTTLDTVVCEGESINFGGQVITATGLYTDSLLTEQGCDSIVNLQVEVRGVQDTTIAKTLCPGDSFVFDNRSLTTSGTYESKTSSSYGCDSNVVLELTVLKEEGETVEKTICPGSTIDFGGQTFSSAGSYDLSFKSKASCDSNITLVITVSSLIQGDAVELALCPGGSIAHDGETYTAVGEYTLSYKTAGGCDSTVQLSVVPAGLTPFRDTVDFCPAEQRNVNGVFASGAGDYENAFKSRGGCDSIHITTVRVRETAPTSVTQLICKDESFAFGDSVYTQAGTYTHELKTKYGSCDSTATLTLTVTDVVAFTVDPVETCEDVPVQLQVTGYSGPISWSPGEGLSCTDCLDPVYSGSMGGIYTASAMGCGGQVVSALAPVIVYEQLSAKIMGGDTTFTRGDSLRLFAESNADDDALHWYADTATVCQGCREIVVTPANRTKYELTAISEGGCNAVAELVLDVKAFEGCSEAGVHVPTAFSPNGDRINDELNIYSELVLEDVTFRVYDRWGNLMYVHQGEPLLWDGTIAGREVSGGVYVYTVSATCPNGKQFTRAGDVTLMR